MDSLQSETGLISDEYALQHSEGMSEYSVLIVPFKVFDMIGLAVLLRHGEDVFSGNDIDVARYVLATLSYCIAYRNNQLVNTQHSVKMQSMQEELLHLQQVEKQYQTVVQQMDMHSSSLDLLHNLPSSAMSRVTSSFMLQEQLHRSIDDIAHVKEYVSSVLTALFPYGAVETASAAVFAATKSADTDVLSGVNGTSACVLRLCVMQHGIGMQDDVYMTSTVLSYKQGEEKESLVTGLLQISIKGVDTLYYALHSGTMLQDVGFVSHKLKMLCFLTDQFVGFVQCSHTYQLLVDQKTKKVLEVEEVCRMEATKNQEEFSQLRSASQQGLNEVQEQCRLQIMQKKYVHKMLMYLWQEGYVLSYGLMRLRDDAGCPVRPKHHVLSSWTRISEKVGFKFAYGTLNMEQQNSIEWIRNEQQLALPERILHHLRGCMRQSQHEIFIFDSVYATEESKHSRGGMLMEHMLTEHKKRMQFVNIGHLFSSSDSVPCTVFVLSSKYVLGTSFESSVPDYFLLYFAHIVSSADKVANSKTTTAIQLALLDVIGMFASALIQQDAQVLSFHRETALVKSVKGLHVKVLLQRMHTLKLHRRTYFTKWKASCHYTPAVHNLERRVAQASIQHNELQYRRFVLADYRHLEKHVNDHLNLNDNVYRDIEALYSCLQEVVQTMFQRVYETQEVQHNTGLIVWTDEDDQLLYYYHTNHVQTQSNRLVEFSRKEGDSSAAVEKKNVLYLGNRVHATLMDIFDAQSGHLQPLYIVNRWEGDQGAVVYMLPIRRDRQTLAVLRITIQHAAAVNLHHIAVARDRTEQHSNMDEWGYDNDSSSSLLLNKRLETSLVFLSALLCPYILYNNIYYHQLQQIQSANKSLASHRRQLEAIEKEVYAAKSSGDVQTEQLHREIAMLREDKYRVEMEKMQVQFQCEALKTQLSESILTQHALDHHTATLLDCISYISSATNVTGLNSLLQSSSVPRKWDEQGSLVLYLQKVIDDYVAFYRNNPESSASVAVNIGINIAITVDRSHDEFKGLERSSLRWLHARETEGDGQDADQRAGGINILLWDYIPDYARTLCVSVVHNAIEKNLKSTIDIPNHNIRVMTIPLVDIYDNSSIGAVQVLREAAAEGLAHHTSIFDDLAALVSRVVSVVRVFDSFSEYVVRQDIDTIHRDNKQHSLEHEIALLRLQGAVHQHMLTLAEETIVNASVDLVVLIETDASGVIQQLRSNFVDIQVQRSLAPSRQRDSEDLVVSQTSIDVSRDPPVSVLITFYQPAHIASQQTYSVFVYHIAAWFQRFLQSLLSMQAKQSRSAEEKTKLKEEVKKAREAGVQDQKQIVDKTAGLYKKYQALKESRKSIESQLHSVLLANKQKLDETSSALSTLRCMPIRAQHENVFSSIHDILQHFQYACSKTSIELKGSHWSYLHFTEPGEVSNAVKVKMMVAGGMDSVTTASDYVIVRDCKLKQALRAGSASDQSCFEQCVVSAQHAFTKSYALRGQPHNPYSASDLIGIDGTLLSRASTVRVAMMGVWGATVASSSRSKPQCSPLTGIVRLVLLDAEDSAEGSDAAAAEHKGEPDYSSIQVANLETHFKRTLVCNDLTAYHLLLQQCCVCIENALLLHSYGKEGQFVTKEAREESQALREQVTRLRQLHKHMMRECSVFMDQPSTLAASSEGQTAGLSVVPYQHIASLPPLQAAQEVGIKALAILRKVLRSNAQCLAFSSATIAQSSSFAASHSSIYNVLYTGDYTVYAGILPGCFGQLTWHPSASMMATQRLGRTDEAASYQSLAEYVMLTGKTVLASDLLRHAYYSPSVDGSHHPEGRYAYLGLPLRGSNGMVVGVLSAVRRGEEFSREERVAAELVAGSAALSLYWCSGLASRHYALHKAFQKIQKLESVLLDEATEKALD
ncbi:MAG: GAF domain-containing protein [Chitinophagaceae bacterium]|nr:MAG: GAF domain-containing protein [Chitinophagaceae bacterium]